MACGCSALRLCALHASWAAQMEAHGVVRLDQPGVPAPVPPAPKGKGLLATPTYDSRWNEEYATFLDGLKQARLIWDFWYEPFSLRLSKACFYRPDFLVQLCDGLLELREVKGWWREDAKVKWKQAIEKYPCFTFVLV